MSGEPGDDELAAIAAAYALLARARTPAPAPPPPSRWRLAGRVEPGGASAPGGSGRRSAWRTAAGP